jgi:hypothetical protein
MAYVTDWRLKREMVTKKSTGGLIEGRLAQ